MVPERLRAKLAACFEGMYPSSLAAARTFSLIASVMRGESLRARDTVDSATPARRATSARVGLAMMSLRPHSTSNRGAKPPPSKAGHPHAHPPSLLRRSLQFPSASLPSSPTISKGDMSEWRYSRIALVFATILASLMTIPLAISLPVKRFSKTQRSGKNLNQGRFLRAIFAADAMNLAPTQIEIEALEQPFHDLRLTRRRTAFLIEAVRISPGREPRRC